jgi:hypothetical protein
VGKRDSRAFVSSRAISRPLARGCPDLALAGRPATLVVVAGEERVRDGRLLRPPEGAYDALQEAGRALAAWRLAGNA